MFGLLNVNKPAGITSRDAVNRVQRIVRPAKVGHAGTLDPLASGVLVICVGPATRLIEYVQRMEKQYRGTFVLGRRSDTEDVQGDVVELHEPPKPTRQQIEEVLPRLIGEIQQRPPAFSALKVKGRRAYALARQGQQVELEPRKVVVHGINVVEYEYPQLTLDILCGSGVYVRSLGRDLAESLGTAAVMSDLVRTAIGDFCLEDACQLDQLRAETLEQHLLPATRAVSLLPRVELADDEVERLAQGMTIRNRSDRSGGEIAAFDAAGRLVAIVAAAEDRILRPVRNFPRS